MAKSRKAMSKSLKSTGDAWRAHVANVAKTEGVKYGKAMSLASKGKYGAEWKKIKAGMGSGKKAMQGGEPVAYNDVKGAPVSAKEGFAANAAQAGGKRRTKKARKSRKGGSLLVPL